VLQTTIVLQTSQVIVQITTAQVMAQVLIDEILSNRVHDCRWGDR
jgi:hypothetical protein